MQVRACLCVLLALASTAAAVAVPACAAPSPAERRARVDAEEKRATESDGSEGGPGAPAARASASPSSTAPSSATVTSGAPASGAAARATVVSGTAVPASSAAAGAATAAPPVEVEMRDEVRDLLGDDVKRSEAARRALVKAGPAAAEALMEGLSVPSGRETIVEVAIEAGEPTATRVLRAAVELGHVASLLQLLARKRADDLLWALRQPTLARAVEWMAGKREERATLGTIIADYAKSWPAFEAAVSALRPSATGAFAAFLDEIASRARGAPAAWPPGPKSPVGSHRKGR